MALSNAERQRRYVARLKERAKAPLGPAAILHALAKLRPVHVPKGFVKRLTAEGKRLSAPSTKVSS
jgi:hypothetical protein